MSVGIHLREEVFEDRCQFQNVLLVDLSDISNPECIGVCHFSRIDRIAAVFDILVHFLKRELVMFRIEKCRDDRSLIFVIDIRTDPHFFHFRDQKTVVVIVAFGARWDPLPLRPVPPVLLQMRVRCGSGK